MFTVGLCGIKDDSCDCGHRVPFFIYWKNGNLLSPREIPKLTGFCGFYAKVD